jgi:hypothetical protein
MKVIGQRKEFKPVTIVLESSLELAVLAAVAQSNISIPQAVAVSGNCRYRKISKDQVQLILSQLYDQIWNLDGAIHE